MLVQDAPCPVKGAGRDIFPARCGRRPESPILLYRDDETLLETPHQR